MARVGVRAAVARVACAAALAAVWSSPALAQGGAGRPAPAPHGGSVEVSGGAAFSAPIDLGSADANLTRNPGTGSGPYTLFKTDTSVAAGVGVQARVAGYLSPALAIEGGVRMLRPRVETRITSDAESAEDTTASERLSRYIFEGSLVLHVTKASFAGSRGVPFVAGGAGYLRDLHEGNELVETGVEYHAAGGLKYWFSDRPRRAGLRAEAGVSILHGGYSPGGSRRTVPVGAVSLLFLF
jgi:hypothetical protein